MIPLILGAMAIGGSIWGVAKGMEGYDNMSQAEEIAENAQERYEEICRILEKVREETNEVAAKYGDYQMSLTKDTMGRFVKLFKRLKRKISIQDLKFLEGFEGFSLPEIETYKKEVLTAENYFKGLGGAAVGGVAASSAATGLATSIGIAGTGTAISGLSGAAATNATLAWLGGGSLAAGGGGMALGGVVLGGITLAPALAIGGFMIAGQGEKALTEAKKYKAKVEKAIAQIEEGMDFLGLVQERIDELENILNKLEKKANLAMNKLEKSMIRLNFQITGHRVQQTGLVIMKCAKFFNKENEIVNKSVNKLEESVKDFKAEIDAEIFQETALLIKAIMEIMRTPVLDGQGYLNPVTANIRAKYRDLIV